MMLPASFHSLHGHLFRWPVSWLLTVDLISLYNQILLHQSPSLINKICVFTYNGSFLFIVLLLRSLPFTLSISNWLFLKPIINALVVIGKGFYLWISWVYFVQWRSELVHCGCFAFYSDGKGALFFGWLRSSGALWIERSEWLPAVETALTVASSISWSFILFILCDF